MLDKINRMPQSNLECRTTTSGRGNVWVPPHQLQSKESECSLLSLRISNENGHSLRVPRCFLPGKLPAGCSTVTIIFKATQFPKPCPPEMASGSDDAHEFWNEAAISNAMLISKIENLNEQLTVAEPVNFVRVK
jgi:hypothetical protein